MSFRLSAPAAADLILIYEQSAIMFGFAQADRYQDGLERAFDFISQYPLASRLREEMARPVRVHAHGAHVILYAVVDGEVRILRIRHRAEDWVGQDPSA